AISASLNPTKQGVSKGAQQGMTGGKRDKSGCKPVVPFCEVTRRLCNFQIETEFESSWGQLSNRADG
ncbi:MULTISPECIES: hypothetical protein, partial [unclassified Aerococcus]|uniref:hypothetical protein n=1 Tax=unclassified Aerococcus TaxID=2618060 RepID=UPI001AEF40B0